ncbi:FAD/NAD(P)-binding protein [Corynebacterium propinquum]|uniref:FAD/NAD(P)-binding protein n=2 Tax=Corynebacterium propinquum TaxID=43769 RepID=A0AAP4C048_9CORY|nr:FAD/NAD(P)-binding protein [Corynebacterium propinquum]MCG7231926.1 FAD/NAD(P)-binding protein [Corynebacterium propinquum]MDK4235932.1 FAD/NAD(P)-binding protein [Corynebacterium propinquum]MDK4251712.1 FAD/NAD(P)-binding protein [Corynebacterium propinquum]MDK4303881.1 FAD/NAD(P)-binding protein [Corynebacterium propinquum]MDK4313771.1 FAD/NAD(P)-binding protein [Corynebacterium propinquum]
MRLAILGVGAGGTFLLSRLAELSSPDWAGGEIFLFEDPECLGAGLAFNRDVAEAIINTGRSRLASLAPPFYPLDRYFSQSPFELSDFNSNPLPREAYGTFLIKALSYAIRILQEHGLRISLVPEKAKEVNFSPGKIKVLTEGKFQVEVDQAVISIGTWNKKNSVKTGGIPYIPFPYPLKRILQIFDNPSAIGVLGSGLTAIDIASVYEKRAATVHLFSPSGRLPWVQVESDEDTLDPLYLTEDNLDRLQYSGSLSASSVLDLLDAELARFGMSRASFDDESRITRNWQNPYSDSADLSCHRTISKTNHVLNAAFASLSVDERFTLRQGLGSGWPRYRVRVPLARWRQIKKMIEEDRIILHAGVWADSRQLGSILSDIGAAGLINATGFSAKYEDAPFFLRQLAAEGHIGLDAEGRGLSDYFTGRAISSDGEMQDNLFLMGQATAGSLLVTSALDAVHRQANHIAENLHKEFCKI